MTRSPCALSLYVVSLAAVAMLNAQSLRADDAVANEPVPTKHQLMKACMAKEKDSDAGMPKEDMKKDCKAVTKTESENAKTEQKAEQQDPAQSTATAPQAATTPHE